METLLLKDVILNSLQCEEADDLIQQVFAKRNKNGFEATSETVVLSLTEEEAAMKIKDIADSKCPGFDYFLEFFILQDFFEDIKDLTEYESDEEKVKRVIYYAEFDA